MRRLLADPAMPKLTARLEQSVADLTRRVDALTTKVVDRSEITALTQAIADIRASLSASRAPGADAGVVEKRIDALSAKIDEVMREPLGLVGQHLADLSARLGQQTPAGVPNIAFKEIRDKLDRIVERADTRSGAEPAAFDSHALDEVKERLDRLSAKIEQGRRRLPDNGSIADLRERLDRLASSIEKSTTQSAPEKIDRVLRQIAANMDAARQATPISECSKLPSSVKSRRSPSRVGSDAGSSPAPRRARAQRASPLRRIGGYQGGKAWRRAAEAASSGAASQHSETVATQQGRLGEEREMHSALDQMNQTLERIMTRLSSIEEHARPSAAAQEHDHLPELIGAERAGDQRRQPRIAPGRPSARLPRISPTRARISSSPPRRAPRERLHPECRSRGAELRISCREYHGAAGARIRASRSRLSWASVQRSPAAKTAKPGATIARQAPSADLSAAVGSGGAYERSGPDRRGKARRRRIAAARQGTSISASPASTAKSAFLVAEGERGKLHKKPILLALIGLMVTFSADRRRTAHSRQRFPLRGARPVRIAARHGQRRWRHGKARHPGDGSLLEPDAAAEARPGGARRFGHRSLLAPHTAESGNRDGRAAEARRSSDGSLHSGCARCRRLDRAPARIARLSCTRNFASDTTESGNRGRCGGEPRRRSGEQPGLHRATEDCRGCQ